MSAEWKADTQLHISISIYLPFLGLIIYNPLTYEQELNVKKKKK